MYQSHYKQLLQRTKPIDIIVSGLGFMGFGFIDGSYNLPNIRISLVISRRPEESKIFLENHGYRARIITKSSEVKDNKQKAIISVTDNLDLIKKVESEILFEVTGTVNYGAEVVLKGIEAGKHILTMNPELQVTLGTQLKKLTDKKNLRISDVYGDQPGSLARLIMNARMMGFKVLVAGNMKRYRDNYATQEKMLPWAKDKGLAVRQTVSFTDGTKQAIEMNLVANYFQMDILSDGMKGIQINDIKEATGIFENQEIPDQGVVDYGIGMNLFPGVFCIVEHHSSNQQKYLRYLGLGDGPRYVIFEPYHLCHLDVVNSIAEMILSKQPIINNSDKPLMRTVTYAKRDLKKGEVLDGIGGDMTRGDICREKESKQYLPAGLSIGSKLKKNMSKDSKIKISDVTLPKNKATQLFLE